MRKLWISGFILILMYSCVDSMYGDRYRKLVSNCQASMEEWYDVDGLFNHFPESIPADSVLNATFGMPVNMIESNYTADLIVSVDIDERCQQFYPDTFIYRTFYQDLNFIIDSSFKYYKYYEKQKVRNDFRKGSFPIPYFEDYDFGIGVERIDFVTDSNFEWVFDKHVVPNDLEVFVLKAGKGDFWVEKCMLTRPETMGAWKNGYSCGVAISKNHNMAVYWMMVW